MRKAVIMLMCSALLWGCSDSKTQEPIEEQPPTLAPTEAPTVPKARNIHGLDMIVTGDQIDFVKYGYTKQTIKLDFTVKDEDIIFRDFNADGANDLFIPRNQNDGVYWMWDQYENKFADAPDMGTKLLDRTSDYPEIFPELDPVYVRAMNGGNVYYYCSGFSMIMYCMEFYRTDDDGTEYKDYYLCYDGEKGPLRWREKWTADGWQEQFVHPHQVYFEKTDTAIYVHLSSDDRVVQTIEGDFSGYTYPKPDNWIAAEASPNDEIIPVNSDMDQYMDIFVRTDPEDKTVGIYYRFDPDKLLFVESDLEPMWKQ
ncbi:MAG: hypothetical protein IJ071_05825 [Ruminococcus sp.]|nr:hypothetical protein [Ruminococcus sp.]